MYVNVYEYMYNVSYIVIVCYGIEMVIKYGHLFLRPLLKMR